MVGDNTRRIGTAIIALLLVGTGTVLGVTLTSMNFNPMEPGQGGVPDSSLTINSESLSYSGLDVTSLTLDIENTDTVDHTGDVHVSLVDSGGTSVTSASNTGVSFAGNNTVTTVTVSLTATNVTSFQNVKVRIEETA